MSLQHIYFSPSAEPPDCSRSPSFCAWNYFWLLSQFSFSQPSFILHRIEWSSWNINKTLYPPTRPCFRPFIDLGINSVSNLAQNLFLPTPPLLSRLSQPHFQFFLPQAPAPELILRLFLPFLYLAKSSSFFNSRLESFSQRLCHHNLVSTPRPVIFFFYISTRLLAFITCVRVCNYVFIFIFIYLLQV